MDESRIPKDKSKNTSIQGTAPGQDASSIMNMLRNGTETGLPAHWMPTSGFKSRSSIRNEFTENHRPRQSSQDIDGKLGVMHGSSDTSFIHHMDSLQAGPNHQLQQQRELPHRPRQTSNVHKMYKGHVISRQHVLPTNFESRAMPSHGRPRSPFAYPTRLKRPGYRPSSPAYSDTYQISQVPTFGSRPSSPLSTQSMSRVPSPWVQQKNHSDPSLMHYPPFLTQSNSPLRNGSPHGSRSSTPRATPSLRSSKSPSLVKKLIETRTQYRNATVPTTESPLFYDYSEGFTDLGHRIDDRAGRTDDSRRTGSIVDQNTSTSEPRLVPRKPVPDNELKAKYIKISQTLEGVGVIGPEENIMNAEQVSSSDLSSRQELASSDLQNRNATTAEADHSSSSESMRTAESYSREPVEKDQSESSPLALTDLQRVLSVETIETQFLDRSINTIQEASFRENSTFTDSDTILSPTPERSLLSEVNRHRFSRILGTEDEPMRRRPTKSYSPSEPMPKTVDPRYQRDSDRPCDSVKDNSFTLNSNRDDSDSDDAPTLSASLLRTFGQPRKSDKIISQCRDHAHTTQQVVTPEDQTTGKSLSPTESKGSQIADQDQDFVGSSTPDNELYTVVHEVQRADISQLKETTNSGVDTQRTVIAITPPAAKKRKALPFAFLPVNTSSDEPSTVSSAMESTLGQAHDALSVDQVLEMPSIPAPKDMLRATDRDSVASSRASRPWNRDSNYPWNDESLKLDVSLPQEHRRTPSPLGRFPKFKLRIQRASMSSNGTGPHTKSRSSSAGTTTFSRNSSLILRQQPVFKSKGKQKTSAGPTQTNSSHAIGNDTLRSRFTESFEFPSSPDTKVSYPAIKLVPTSQGHEVQSFFSDDSSQSGQKGSLRKRLSNLKGRHALSKSPDASRGQSRGRLNVSLGRRSQASGRASRQSQTTTAESHPSGLKRPSSRRLRKIRLWWQTRGDRFRKWRLLKLGKRDTDHEILDGMQPER